MKQFGPWKDHWVIQLIAVRSEMHNTFSAPPKQGIVCYQFVLYFVFFFSPKHISHICYVCSAHCSFIWCQHSVPSTAQLFWPNADAFCPIFLCLPHFWPLLCTLFRLQSFHYRASGAEQKGFSCRFFYFFYLPQSTQSQNSKVFCCYWGAFCWGDFQ